jgi:hypothetical protein
VRENHSKGELDMPMKKHKPEQIVALLRQVEVELAYTLFFVFRS